MYFLVASLFRTKAWEEVSGDFKEGLKKDRAFFFLCCNGASSIKAGRLKAQQQQKHWVALLQSRGLGCPDKTAARDLKLYGEVG